MAFVLTIAEGKWRGQKFSFETAEASIGRGAGNDLVLDDAGVSRTHARIRRQGGGFVLLDNGSSNGTELNGVVIGKPSALRAGDCIGVGPVVFEFAVQPPARAAAGRETRSTSAPRARATRVPAMPEAHGAVAPRAGAMPKPVKRVLLARLPAGARIGVAAVAALFVIGVARLLVSGLSKNGPLVTVVQSQKGGEWGAGRVRVDRIAGTPGDLRAAREAYGRGRRKLEERRVAPRNLYDAWQSFTTARRNLEGLSPRPALYDEVAQLIKDCERDLDKECSKMIFTASRFERYQQDEKAQQTYREMLLHFPGDEPAGCRKKAQENLVSGKVEASE